MASLYPRQIETKTITYRGIIVSTTIRDESYYMVWCHYRERLTESEREIDRDRETEFGQDERPPPLHTHTPGSKLL